MNSNLYYIKSKIKKLLFSFEYLPRWAVFFMDILLTIFSSEVSYLIVRSLRVKFYDTVDVPTRYGIIVLVYIIFFIIFKTYSGIIRYSTFIDGIKLLYSTLCTLFTLIIINYSTYFLIGKKIYLLPSLFINFLITFSVLFLFRIFIKIVFENITSFEKNPNVLKAVIYGADSNAISVVTALQSEKINRFQIVGFIDKRNSDISKRILDIPILNSKKKTSVVLRAINAQVLILSDNSLSNIEKLKIVEDCLESNIKVYNSGAITDWENQDSISKKVIEFKIEDLLERSPISLDQEPISNLLFDKIILITGAAGSIGSELAKQIITFNPAEIIILDQAETPLHFLSSEMEKLNSNTKITTIITDVRNKETLKMVFKSKKPEVVYHAAAYKHVPMMEENPSQAIFTNVLGTINTADLAVEYEVENFVFISTDKAVNPSNVMGASKRIAERYIQGLSLKAKNEKSNIKFITTRFGNVLGSNGSVVPLFTEQIQNGGPITITHPDVIRYFMTIPEACQLVIEAGAMGNGGEIFIFDMGEPVKIIDLARKMILLAGLMPEIDIKIKTIGLRPGEKLYEELLNNKSKTVPTHNSKIMIANDISTDYDLLFTEVEELITFASYNNNNKLVAKMKEIVPEFVSMNSQYNRLDN
ncbi:MAG: nucleoside-diphosphate sugar epimerase/dehydratase [Flavobacterium sp.]|jgi:FlaA1/EpsC-like NDP-sugar epimerase|nr:nucleoside-diphosphate sugar epimerase/dehydratase [Flavobacterium sp.]